MHRTISFRMGDGSQRHNSRAFNAENVDENRTHLNIEYRNEDIKDVYHELFDGALERYNANQPRKDRRIPDYYEHIETGGQEKLFYEIIVQVGNKDDMPADSENGELAKTILDEYFQFFEERNPFLRVYSAHLHMDEATPHLHIEFVPFTTGSNRGLDTRVSMKQAMLNQGFKGGKRGDTEWSQWAASEKKALAHTMQRHGVEWEQKGTHEQHLSVLDYKKQERLKEVEALDKQIAEKQDEFKSLQERVLNYDEGLENIRDTVEKIDTDLDYQLPEPTKFMSAKFYKEKFVEPLIRKLKFFIKTLAVRAFEGWDNYHRLNAKNGNLYRENERLSKINDKLTTENSELKEQNKDYRLLRRVFGSKQIDSLLEQARERKKSNRAQNRPENKHHNER